MNPAVEFSRCVRLEDLAAAETVLEVEAGPDERAALARRFGVLSVDRLSAVLRLSHDGAIPEVCLSGTLSARLTQACVVTLEPVRAEVEALIERRFVGGDVPPPGATGDVPRDTQCGGRPRDPRDAAAGIDPEADDPPDPLVDGTIDVGEAVAEQLSLEIDPFPRARDACFDGYSSASDDSGNDPDDGPFAELSAWNRKD